jgi:hypothetical protein
MNEIFRSTLGLPCYPEPLDIDPDTPGEPWPVRREVNGNPGIFRQRRIQIANKVGG